MSQERFVSPWRFKPWWCQPWSIGLTGSSLIVGSWVVVERVWFTVLVALPVLVWMGFFLLVWPRLVVQQPGWPTVDSDRAP